MGTPAKVLTPGEVRRFQARANHGRHALRNKVIVTLSFRAGLRACEIAGLEWGMVLGAGGRVAPALLIADAIAKNGRGRRLPMHSDLKAVLERLHREQGRPMEGPVVRSQRGGHMTPGSIVNWFKAKYNLVGLQGCSSHSGRRTFITRSARLIAKAGGCLKDVQELAGHRSITTTEGYIEGDREAQRRLIRML
jgi:integrase/recombinase XerD